MADLSWLTQGTPTYSTGTQNTSTVLPDWLQNYEQGIAGKSLDVANQPYQAYPGQRLADFTPDQQQSFSQVRNNQGSWQPSLNAANGALGNVMPSANGRLDSASAYGSRAVGSVAGPAQAWTDNWQQYMSPYTSQVTNEIGRLGNRNLQENLIPSVQDQFLGSGQFGSTRNADILGRTVRDAQADISGKQAQALEAGYGTSANIFSGDANRTQQQQQMQAQAALNAGQMQNNSAQIGGQLGLGVAQNYGALGSNQASLGLQDANALYGTGAKQQGLQQTGLDTSYQDFLNQRDYDKNNLSWLKGNITGLPLSSTSSSSTTMPTSQGTSAASYLTSGLGLLNEANPNWANSLFGTTK